MKSTLLASLALAVLGVAAVGCSTTPKTEGQRLDLRTEARSAVADMRARDSSLQRFFDDSYGYAIFPNVGKGGFIVGGAWGRGVVYEQGAMIGYSDLTKGTIGAQIGGQVFHQLIFFHYKEALDHFKTGNWALAADASAVIVTAGAAASADYDRGVAVFALSTAGAMAEAAVGGQKFSYEPR